MVATLVWECVPEFNIMRTRTMSCIYLATEAAKPVNGPAVGTVLAMGDQLWWC